MREFPESYPTTREKKLTIDTTLRPMTIDELAEQVNEHGLTTVSLRLDGDTRRTWFVQEAHSGPMARAKLYRKVKILRWTITVSRRVYRDEFNAAKAFVSPDQAELACADRMTPEDAARLAAVQAMASTASVGMI
jgi:hypothetical protein